MRKLVASAVALAILTLPAFAQKKEDEPLEVIEKDKQKQTEALDKQYKRMMDRNRKEGDAPKTDPWATMRGPNDGKK